MKTELLNVYNVFFKNAQSQYFAALSCAEVLQMISDNDSFTNDEILSINIQSTKIYV